MHPRDGQVPGCFYSVRVPLWQQLCINISLPVNTLICQGPATLAPALVGWRWGWHLRACRPLACRQPCPPSALIGEPNPTGPGRRPQGRCRPGSGGSSSRCRRRRRRQVQSNQPHFPSIQLPAAPVLLPPCASL